MKFKILSLATAISLATIMTAQAAQPVKISATTEDCVAVELGAVNTEGNVSVSVTNNCTFDIEVNNVSIYTTHSDGTTTVDNYDDKVATTVVFIGDTRSIDNIDIDQTAGNMIEAAIQFQAVPYEKASSTALHL